MTPCTNSLGLRDFLAVAKLYRENNYNGVKKINTKGRSHTKCAIMGSGDTGSCVGLNEAYRIEIDAAELLNVRAVLVVDVSPTKLRLFRESKSLRGSRRRSHSQDSAFRPLHKFP